MDETLQLMKELTEAPGVPGREQEVRAVMRRHLEPVAGEVVTDNLGSIYGVKKGGAARPRILVAGHLDEIGFMVTHITKEGFLKFQTLGGWWEQVMLAQRVAVCTGKGMVYGVIGSKPPHILPQEERKKVVEKAHMYIDIGAAGEDEARAFGVRPGDPVVPVSPFTPMANEKMLLAKAWDNRAGCIAAVLLLRALRGKRHPNTVYAGATVQEEVGLRGATTSANLVEPDIGIAIDTGIAGDTPGVKPEEAQSKLGKGPVILLYDGSMIPHLRLRDLVIETAEAEGIPYQFDSIAGGGTDAGRFHVWGKGAPSIVMGPPVRYIHSHAGIMHRDDMNNLVRLLAAVVARLDAKTVEELRAG